MTLQEVLNKADYYKEEIHKKGPQDFDKLKELDQYFRVNLTFSSNSISGNALSFNETRSLLVEGKEEGEKPAKDYKEAIGHAEAYDYMLTLARAEQFVFTEAVIKKLHFLFCQRLNKEEAGHYRTTRADRLESGYLPPLPEDLPHLMEHFINQMESSRRHMHPIEFATLCHKRLIDIQPFKEGNGRIARLLMNLVFVHAGYGVACIPTELQEDYKNALLLSQKQMTPDVDTLIKFIAGRVVEAQKEYLNRITE